MTTTPVPQSPAPAAGFVVLLPVKPPARGKSRLVGLPDPERAALAAAFAQDTAAAALGCAAVSAVLAVTDDHTFARVLATAGCAVIPDGVGGDLNASLRQAAAEAERRWPTAVPVALTADLPALRSEDLAAVLERVGALPAPGAAFVRDAAGTGTSLYTARHGSFRPRFGSDSAARHLAAGCMEIDAPASVRRDVDEIGDLGAAMALGVGRATSLATGRA